MTVSKYHRIQFIDRLRGLAVVAMFHVHSAVAWMTPEAKQTLYFKYSMKVSGLVAPVFMFLAGISMGLIHERMGSRNISYIKIRKRIMNRGLQIVAMGYGLHILFYTLSFHWTRWLRIFKVDILHCIGLSMVVTVFVAFPQKPDKFNPTAVIIFVGAPILSMMLYRIPIEQLIPLPIMAYFSTRTTLSLFPIIPYVAWLALGLAVSPFFLRSCKSDNPDRFWLGIAIAAATMWLMGYGLKSLYYSLRLHEWKTAIPQGKGVLHFFFFKGANVLALFAIFGATDRLFSDRLPRFLIRFGKASLFAYGLHLIIVYPLLGSIFRRSLSIQTHVIATITLTVAMFGAVLFSEQFQVGQIWRRLQNSHRYPLE